MCGIAGMIARPSAADDGADGGGHPDVVLRAMMQRMVRRGPDGEGSWTDGRVWLGFRRLAILDLTDAAHQPMTTPGGRHALVFNGELYNFRELRAELESRGISFRSSGDSEVVLHSLATWGRAALDRFNGMFALAFRDRDAGTLLLARDHAGIKPLYVADTPRGVVFGSQYDQLLAHPWTRELTLCPDALAIWLRFGHVPAPAAMLRDTGLLEPGGWLQISDEGRITRGRWFEFPRANGELRGDEADEAIGQAIADAVARQCVADVPIGAFLSGGVDSPLVNLMMARAGFRHPVYTAGTGDPATDESGVAARFAADFGLEHVVVPVDESRLPDDLEHAVAACGEPFGSHSLLPTMRIARAARVRGKVLLSGDGGDELFYGYARMWKLPDDARVFRQPRWIRSLRWWWRRFTGLGRARWSWRLADLHAVCLARHTHLQPAPRAAMRIFPTVPPAMSHPLYRLDTSSDDVLMASARQIEYAEHLPRVLLKVDRGTMHESVEARVPLLDRDVIAVASRIDWRHCVSADRRTGKLPLRRLLATGTQAAVPGKAGFEVPVDRYYRGPLRDAFRELMHGRDEFLGLPFRGEAAMALLDEHLAGAHLGSGLWMLHTLVLWADRVFAPARREAASGPASLPSPAGTTTTPPAAPARVRE